MINNNIDYRPINSKNKDKIYAHFRKPFYTNQFGELINIYSHTIDNKEISFLAVHFSGKTKYYYQYKTIRDGKKVYSWHVGIPENLKKINLFGINSKTKDCNRVYIVNREYQTGNKINGWHGISWAGGVHKTIELSDWVKLSNVENVVIWVDERSSRKISAYSWKSYSYRL